MRTSACVFAMVAAVCAAADIFAAGPATKPAPKPTQPPVVVPPLRIPAGEGVGSGGVIGGSTLDGTSFGVGEGAAPSGPLSGTEITGPDARARFTTAMAKVNEFTAAGKYFDAMQSLKTAQSLALDQTQAQQVQAAGAKLDAFGQEWIKDAQKLYDGGDYVAALNKLGLTQRTFNPLPSSVTASDILKRAEKDTKTQTVLQEIKAREMDELVAQIIDCRVCAAAASRPATTQATQGSQPAAQRYLEASRVDHIRKLTLERQSRAVSMLEKIAKLYPLAPTGAAADADLKAIQADKAMWTALQDFSARQQAQSMYDLAETYRVNGMTAKAAELYQQVSDKYPLTPQAAKAKEALAKLK